MNDIKNIAKLSKKVSPNTLITVDGVCAFASEEFRFDDWGIDAAMTASQKALGVPPGLSILMLSERAIQVMQNRCDLVQKKKFHINRLTFKVSDNFLRNFS